MCVWRGVACRDAIKDACLTCEKKKKFAKNFFVSLPFGKWVSLLFWPFEKIAENVKCL